MLFHSLPTLAIVELHPIILAILNFSCILQCLSKKISKIIIVGSVFESEVANVAKVLVEFLCKDISM